MGQLWPLDPYVDLDGATVASNHSPLFFADERALKLGVRALAHLTVAYLEDPG